MNGSFLLPLLIALPVVGALLVMVSPKDEGGLARMLGLSFSVITFLASLGVFAYFRADLGGMQLVFDTVWISSLGIYFKTGIDGISLWLLILTTFMTPLTLWAAKGSIDKHVREFVAAMLLLEAGMIGSFVALDLFVFYVFYEIMLVPMYLLIGIWGGQRRIYASIKFFVFTMVGSLLMLAAIIFLYVTHGQVTGTYTSDLEALSNLILPHQAQVWCFAAFALAFAIKIPLFPVHTWLPDAHVEAPTPGSVILAGVMLKFGIYGFLRFAMPLFPAGAAELAPYIAVLAVIGIVYGALVAFSQDDVKKIVAYSSVSHLGFCALGLFAMTLTGIQGSIFAMLSHGLTTGGLFLGIGVLYERRHTRRLAEYGGIWKQMPIFAGLYLIVTMGSAGLPATSGFIGEFLTIFGTFTASNFPGNYSIPNPMLLGAIAATGVILGAIYLLYMFQKVFFGKLDVAKNGGLKDLNGRELAVFVILCVGIIGMGVAPHRILKSMEPSVQTFVRNFGRGVSEPDGPARLYGTPVPSQPRAARPAPVAQLGVGQ